MRLLYKYIPVLIAFLAVWVLTGFGLSWPVNAAGDNEAVGSFEMEQETGTSGGTTKRNIDISSAWSGAYIHENMTVVGKAEIKESFSMNNIKGSSESDRDFFEGSNPRSGTGNSAGAAESDNSDGDEPASVNSDNPGKAEDNSPGSGNKSEPELETLNIPAWSDLF